MTEKEIDATFAKLALDLNAQMRAVLVPTQTVVAPEDLQVDLTNATGDAGVQQVLRHGDRMTQYTKGRKRAAYLLAINAAMVVKKLNWPAIFPTDATPASHLAGVVAFVRTWHGEDVAQVFTSWLLEYLKILSEDTRLRTMQLFNKERATTSSRE